jgi:preprotein translocase subunit YajC
MASSAMAIRTGTSSAGDVVGRFAATFAAFWVAVLKAGREAVLLGFLDMTQVPDGAALSSLNRCRKPSKVGRWAALQLGPRPLYSARICPEPDLFGRSRFSPSHEDLLMFITPAYAQAAAGGDTNSMLMSLLPFALIFVIMYFLILRPQQKKVKDHAELVKNIRRGDTVVTSGGLVGKVTKVVDDDQIEFEISDGVRVRQMRQMISGVRAKGEPAKDETSSS